MNGLVMAILGKKSWSASNIFLGQCLIGMSERARAETRGTYWQYMPSTRREIARGPAGGGEGWMGSALTSSTSKPQSSMVSVTEGRRNMFSRRRVAELVRRLTTTSDTPGRRDSMSVIVATQDEQDMPPTERVILCGGSALSDEGVDGLS